MTAIEVVDGRDAIRVRSIPLITGRSIDPSEVANYLAHIDGPPFQFFHDVFAFHVIAGKAVDIQPKYWDAVRDRLAALEAILRADHPEEAVGRDRWIAESIDQLPVDVFVWLDEFERAWSRLFPIPAPNERSGDRELNYAAIPLTGFSIATNRPETTAPPSGIRGEQQAAPAGLAIVGAGDTAEMSLADIRVAAIVETAVKLGYKPKAIEHGGKAAIKNECLEKKAGTPHRFTDSTFDAAWKKAVKRKLVEVEDSAKYRSK